MPKLELDKAASDHLSRLLAKHLQETFDLDVDPFDAGRAVGLSRQDLGSLLLQSGRLQMPKRFSRIGSSRSSRLSKRSSCLCPARRRCSINASGPRLDEP